MIYEEPTNSGSGDDSDYEKGTRRSTLMPSKYGDIMSPGWPSDFKDRDRVVMEEPEEQELKLFGTERLKGIENSERVVVGSNFGKFLPLIPVQTISQEAARDIIENLETEVGWEIPNGWKKGNLVQNYEVSNALSKNRHIVALIKFGLCEILIDI